MLGALGAGSLAAEVDCPRNPAQGPRALILDVAATGTDFDQGWTGLLHNFTFATGAKLTYCLSGCNRAGNPNCIGEGSTGAGSLNGSSFGPPVPLVAAGIPLCLTYTFAEPQLNATYNVASGSFVGSIPLTSTVFVTTPAHVCPQCIGGQNFGDRGMCDSGQNAGEPCLLEGFQTVGTDVYFLSSQCLPLGGAGAESRIDLPFTTVSQSLMPPPPCPGQSQLDNCSAECICDGCPGQKPPHGGINQCCCQDGDRQPCFPAMVMRDGTQAVAEPRWPDERYPKSTNGAVLVSVLCIPGTSIFNLDFAAGLPGPAAMRLPVQETLLGPICGDGIVELAEECDQGAENGEASSCCNRDCTLRTSGSVCRAARDICDVAEMCDGRAGACPPDAFASSDTPCTPALEDPCTIKDHCEGGSCVPGIPVCGAVAAQSCTPPLPGARCGKAGLRSSIDVLATVKRDPLGLGSRGGSFQAVGFLTRGPSGQSAARPLTPDVISCRAIGPGEPACESTHDPQLQATDSKERKLSRGGSVLLRLKLNPLARRALRQSGVLDVDICGTIRLPNKRTISLRCTVDVRGRKAGGLRATSLFGSSETAPEEVNH